MTEQELKEARKQLWEVTEKFRKGDCLFLDANCTSRDWYRCTANTRAYNCLLQKYSSLGVVIADYNAKLPKNFYEDDEGYTKTHSLLEER